MSSTDNQLIIDSYKNETTQQNSQYQQRAFLNVDLDLSNNQTTEPSSSSNSSQKSINTNEIIQVAIVVCVITVSIIIGVMVVIFKRRQQRNQTAKPNVVVPTNFRQPGDNSNQSDVPNASGQFQNQSSHYYQDDSTLFNVPGTEAQMCDDEENDEGVIINKEFNDNIYNSSRERIDKDYDLENQNIEQFLQKNLFKQSLIKNQLNFKVNKSTKCLNQKEEIDLNEARDSQGNLLIRPIQRFKRERYTKVKAILIRLPEKTFLNNQCFICDKKIHNRDFCRVLSCLHYFHAVCIDSHFDLKEQSCPICGEKYETKSDFRFSESKLMRSIQVDNEHFYSLHLISARNSIQSDLLDSQHFKPPQIDKFQRRHSFDDKQMPTYIEKTNDMVIDKLLYYHPEGPLNVYKLHQNESFQPPQIIDKLWGDESSLFRFADINSIYSKQQRFNKKFQGLQIVDNSSSFFEKSQVSISLRKGSVVTFNKVDFDKFSNGGFENRRYKPSQFKKINETGKNLKKLNSFQPDIQESQANQLKREGFKNNKFQSAQQQIKNDLICASNQYLNESIEYNDGKVHKINLSIHSPLPAINIDKNSLKSSIYSIELPDIIINQAAPQDYLPKAQSYRNQVTLKPKPNKDSNWNLMKLKHGISNILKNLLTSKSGKQSNKLQQQASQEQSQKYASNNSNNNINLSMKQDQQILDSSSFNEMDQSHISEIQLRDSQIYI
eukprot:403363399